MLNGISTVGYGIQAEGYRSAPRVDRYNKPRLYESPGQPRKNVMKLAIWLDENESSGKTRAWLAEQLGARPATVDQWCNGLRRPRLEKILKIEELTNGQVTAHDWPSPSK